MGTLPGAPKPILRQRSRAASHATSHGIIFTATKYNFLAHDLGFLESDGATYMTGTDDACYIPGYVEDYLEHHVPRAGEIFSPCANGLAVCYGGYFTSQQDLLRVGESGLHQTIVPLIQGGPTAGLPARGK
ncbi:MAG: hypothetical protein ACJA2W_002154 [Planctomycetota bacterium]|jgi:hypothetical protein